MHCSKISFKTTYYCGVLFNPESSYRGIKDMAYEYVRFMLEDYPFIEIADITYEYANQCSIEDHDWVIGITSNHNVFEELEQILNENAPIKEWKFRFKAP